MKFVGHREKVEGWRMELQVEEYTTMIHYQLFFLVLKKFIILI